MIYGVEDEFITTALSGIDVPIAQSLSVDSLKNVRQVVISVLQGQQVSQGIVHGREIDVHQTEAVSVSRAVAHRYVQNVAVSQSEKITSQQIIVSGPLAIFGANLVAWYSADKQIFRDTLGSPVSNGQTVAQWNDLSGNNNNVTQQVSGAGPGFLSTGFNGLPTVSFPFTAAGLVTAASVEGIGSGVTALSVFIVGQMASGTPNNGRCVSFMASGQTNDYDNFASLACIRNGTANQVAGYQSALTLSPDNISLATSYRIGFVFDGTNETTYVNDIAAASSPSSAAFGSTGLISIGNGLGTTGANGSFYWSGPISEVVVFKGIPTTTQLQNLDSYFRNHWNFPPLIVPHTINSAHGQAVSVTGVNPKPRSTPGYDGVVGMFFENETKASPFFSLGTEQTKS